MIRAKSHCGTALESVTRRIVSLMSVVVLCAISSSSKAEDASQTAVPEQIADKLMSEEHRTAIQHVVVLPGISPPAGSVTGSYERGTDGLLDGIARGREFGVIRTEIGGIPIGIPIPVLTVPGMIIGGLLGGVDRAVQDSLDALTNDLKNSADSRVSSDALATDVFWGLNDVQGLNPKVFIPTTPIPDNTDAIIYIGYSDPTINVDGKNATIEFTAQVTVRRLSDGEHLYENKVSYKDRDSLQNWTRNDNAAWHDFANYARHYLGREIVAELYERTPVIQDLRPLESDNVSRVKKMEWQGVSKSQTPTLAWALVLDESEVQADWARSVSQADVLYDVEVYDQHQLVYKAKKISGSQHVVGIELEACKNYRWSVRPSYQVDGSPRFGEWMRSDPDSANGNMGKEASTATAYIYDFASLEIKCGRR